MFLPKSVSTPAFPRFVLPLLTVFVLSACLDAGPSAPVAVAPELDAPRTPLALFECTARVSGSVECEADGGPAAAPSGIVVGGQGLYLQLTSSNVAYDGGTEIFQFDVTVQNFLNEAIGTPIGSVPDPDGIRVFFLDGPTASVGSGTLAVANADGSATITAADQPFFQYNEVLTTNEVSSAKTWQLAVPPSVVEFTFTLAVDTDVQYLLVVNELLVNPGGTISDASGEWIEIYNAGTLAVQMEGLIISDSAASGRRPYITIHAPFELEPAGYYVLGSSANTTLNGGVPVDYSYTSATTSMAFANSLDAFKMSRVVGTDTLTIERVQYASAAISAQNGISRELRNPLLDNANIDGSNWADALVTAVYGPGGRGTPGAQNSTYTP